VALLFRERSAEVGDFSVRAERLGLFHVTMEIGAPGVHRLPAEDEIPDEP
jgi:hypothetical protein